nr:2005_t:CDS:2 [Entrophospora candida]
MSTSKTTVTDKQKLEPIKLTSHIKNAIDILTKLPDPIPKNTDIASYQHPILIGSQAAKYHVPSFRDPVDWDIIATPSQTSNWLNSLKTKHEVELEMDYYKDICIKIQATCTVNVKGIEDVYNYDVEVVIGPHDMKEIINQEIEIGVCNHDSSSKMIMDICCDDRVVGNTIFLPPTNLVCSVASLEVLEALKSSHIIWPYYFDKHIDDLHSLRILLGCGDTNVPKSQPLTGPSRSIDVETMLKLRINETKKIRGIPGAHINLNQTNEEFLDREDDLVVTRFIKHDDIHEIVKYGGRPIYADLKVDQSKAWIEKSLFQQIDYDTQLKCVKEEAMVISLERYLIPQLTSTQEKAYNLALSRICTTLTKNWFRQFAIDNYPRLTRCDKDLMPIAKQISEGRPLNETIAEESIELYNSWVKDAEDRLIVEPLHSRTTDLSFNLSDWSSQGYRGIKLKRTGIEIRSPVVDPHTKIPISFIYAIATCAYRGISGDDCNPGCDWWGCLSIRFSKDQSEDESTQKDDFPFLLDNDDYYGRSSTPSIKPNNILTFEVNAYTSGGSWGGEDIWREPSVIANDADNVASQLRVPGLNGNLLVKYVLAHLQPSLRGNGEAPLKHRIDKLKAEGKISSKPKQHLWYDLWEYALNDGWNEVMDDEDYSF